LTFRDGRADLADLKAEWERKRSKTQKDSIGPAINRAIAALGSERGVSLEAQEAKIRAMATVQGAELLEVIVDGGESAKSLNRPGLQRLPSLVNRRKGAGHHRREARPAHPQRQGPVRVAGAIRETQSSAVSVAESLDTGSAAGRLVITIMGAVSQWEREAIGERTRDALQHKRNQGQRVGNIAFGSRLTSDGKHLEPDPAEQAASEEIRRRRDRGAPDATGNSVEAGIGCARS